MGYTTEFEGRFTLDRPLTVEHLNILSGLSEDDQRDAPGAPGAWCKWIPTEDGAGIKWDGNEKFYDYVEWLQYIIERHLKPWGYVLNGRVVWDGEDRQDVGTLAVTDNVLSVLEGHIDGEITPAAFEALRALVEAVKGSDLSYDDCDKNDELFKAVAAAERTLKAEVSA